MSESRWLPRPRGTKLSRGWRLALSFKAAVMGCATGDVGPVDVSPLLYPAVVQAVLLVDSTRQAVWVERPRPPEAGASTEILPILDRDVRVTLLAPGVAPCTFGRDQDQPARFFSDCLVQPETEYVLDVRVGIDTITAAVTTPARVVIREPAPTAVARWGDSLVVRWSAASRAAGYAYGERLLPQNTGGVQTFLFLADTVQVTQLPESLPGLTEWRVIVAAVDANLYGREGGVIGAYGLVGAAALASRTLALAPR